MTEPQIEDDPTILDPDELWRRIPPMHLVPDENSGGLRISSAAFDNDRNGAPMSVVLGTELLRAGRRAAEVLDGHQQFSLASIRAQDARQARQGLVRDPTPTEPQHALVHGRKTGAVRRQLAKVATWVIGPEDSAGVGNGRA